MRHLCLYNEANIHKLYGKCLVIVAFGVGTNFMFICETYQPYLRLQPLILYEDFKVPIGPMGFTNPLFKSLHIKFTDAIYY